VRAQAALLAEIQEEASLAGLAHIYPPELYPFPTDAVRARWAAFDGWVEVERDGFVAVVDGWLEAMYVRPSAWGSGLAVRLHAAAVAELERRSTERARLWVLERNDRARRFYERHGWHPDGTSRVVEFPPNPIDLGYELRFR
jgi:GNAT superfamily N-acetyltransferase